jgi:hypothetical protein
VLRDEGESAASVAFDELMDVPTLIMPRRQIRAKFVEPVLHAWGLDLSQVGYLNLLKWRTKGDYGIRRLYRLSWNDHTRDQLDLLEPGSLIAIWQGCGRMA